MGELISPARAKGIKRMLWVAILCGVVLALFAVLAATDDETRYAIMFAVIAALLLASAGFTLRVLPTRDVRARRGAISTGVLMLLLALPAGIPIALIMAIGGVGMLFIVFSKEVEA